MPEFIRSVVSRVRMFVKDRRSSSRLRVRLLCSISVGGKTNGNSSGHLARLLKGYTRDLSQDGLALSVPQVHLDGHHLATEERDLQLKLELPDGPISMLVSPRRYERLDEAELGCGYLIGVQIVQISDEDRRLYLSFIAQGLQGNL
ncbi:MAG TPA: PilZ domain-containing protein [Pyrinomonadaceae bacterium]|nr:PilZ domain-containing protein [Pyrinomonadaceae bacterium]